MRTAEVVRADAPASQLAAAGALLASSAGLADQLTDHDLPYGPRGVATLAAGRLEATGTALVVRT
jgi:hypothetical protein